MKIKHLLLAGSALLAVSCTTRVADLTVASTKNMDLKHTAGYTTTYNVRSKGEDKKHIIVFFPTGIPDMKEAIDNAIEKMVQTVLVSPMLRLNGNGFTYPSFTGRNPSLRKVIPS